MPEINVRVAASTDDTRLSYNGSTWTINNTTSYGMIGYYDSSNYKRGVGLRFLNVTIPQGATITAAYIQLTSLYEMTPATVKAYIVGEDTDDAATFSTLSDYQARRGTVVGGANDNNITTAKVDWDPVESFGADGTTHNTPDIKTIIQEIVDRPGFVSGNDIVIWIDDHDGRSTAASNTTRDFKTYDGTPAAAPLLYVEYTEAGATGVSPIPRLITRGLL